MRRSDAVTKSALGWSVAASVVATALTSYWGASRVATLGGAAASPLIMATFTTQRSPQRGGFRIVAIALLSIAALAITITGFTLPEVATGKSLIADRPGTFVPLPGDCDNAQDDDSDGLTDGEDPGCQDGNGLESSVDPEFSDCDNGGDDDGDGLTDSDDPGCQTGSFEASDVEGDCDNGGDDDGDGLTDSDDPGCQDGNGLESSVDPEFSDCDNGGDDDGDGLTDSDDPGCQIDSFEDAA